MSHQKRFTRKQVLEQLFSQQPSSEPEEDAKEPDREADGQAAGVADREEDRDYGEDNSEDDVEDDLEDEEEDDGDDEDYDPVGDASVDLSSLDKEEEGQEHGCTTTPTTGLVERETFPSRNGEITWSSRAYDRVWGRCSSSSAVAATLSGVRPGSRAGDIASTFRLFIMPTVENIILEMTNREGSENRGWPAMQNPARLGRCKCTPESRAADAQN